ncbi:MAG: AraC family transcriptional regulator [Cyclobacteriaceae bacterium]|jgi:AraC-like DNA-binding protein|nr:AraC family transcriptional regulator [Cyclobacteriaceae bacterium]
MEVRVVLAALGGVAVLNTLVMAGLLWANHRGSVKSKLLALIFFCLAVRVGKSLLVATAPGQPTIIPAIGLLGMIATGPLFWLYVGLSRSTAHSWQWRNLWHFIPLPIATLLLLTNSEAVVFWLYVFGAGQLLLYLGAAARTAHRFPPDGRKKMSTVFTALAVLWMVYASQIFIETTSAYLVATAVAVVALYALAYYAFRHHRPFRLAEREPLPDSASPEHIAKRLLELMEREQLFKTPDLTTARLASEVNVKPYIISSIVNSRFSKTIPDFVNDYRLREAERMLASNAFVHYSVEGIAFDCGFNTPSAFYAQFRRKHSCTPLEYREQAKRVPHKK